MAQSVAVLYHGWEYQARLFWMFQNCPNVERVGLERVRPFAGRSRTGNLADGALYTANRFYPALEEQ